MTRPPQLLHPGALVALVVLAGLLFAPPARANQWCAPELETISEHVCYFAPDSLAGDQRTLVIFLHGLTGDGSTWQWEQQRLMSRTAAAHQFAVLMPRGRLSIGPGRDPKTWAWPTSARAQAEVEQELLDEWAEARALVERKHGAFARTFVFGFSNGAYYASSLALRGKLDIDGYGVFAGGSGNKYQRLLAERCERRVPIFLGYGTKDPDSKNQRAFAKLLKATGWRHRVKSARVGHTVTDTQIREALRFLAGEQPATNDKSRSEAGPSP